jgi:hypothetical protein
MMFWTSVLVVLIGVVISLVMLQPLTPEASLIVSHAYARTHKTNREPASIHPVQVQATGQPKFSLTQLTNGDVGELLEAIDLKIPCDKTNKSEFAHGVIQARLTGQACAPDLEIESTEVRNETNNFSATVFHTGVRAYLTDYITLAQGDNKIRILQVYKNGSKEERSYTIVREAKKSEDI